MDEHQVDPVDAELGRAHLEGLARLAHPVPLGVQLRRDEDLLARHAARAHAAADALLVAVGVRGVDQAVAQPDRLGHRALGLAVAHRPGAEAEAGHAAPVEQFDGGAAGGTWVSTRSGRRR